MKKSVPHDNSRFRSAAETHNSRTENRARNQKLWSWKIKPLHVFSIILALILLAGLFVLQFTSPKKVLKHVKTKRFVKMNDCLEESENADTVREDIRIIPEGQLNFAERANRHPNHRYLETDSKGNIYKKIKNLYDESGRSPKPFDAKADERFMKNVKMSMSKKKPKGTENFYEINNLIDNYSGSEGENAAIKNAFKNRGAPFQVPVKDGPVRGRLNSYESSSSKRKQLWFKERFEKRPLTIFLNIYPMAENHDYFKKDAPKVSHVVKTLRNEFSKGGDIHSAGKFLFPQEGRSGIIMKLNLYAKETKFPSRQTSIRQPEDAIHLNDRKRAEEKSFGWFSKKKPKQQERKQCSLAGISPHGKHVTAKWRNGNGEWIHANHVSVKY